MAELADFGGHLSLAQHVAGHRSSCCVGRSHHSGTKLGGMLHSQTTPCWLLQDAPEEHPVWRRGYLSLSKNEQSHSPAFCILKDGTCGSDRDHSCDRTNARTNTKRDFWQISRSTSGLSAFAVQLIHFQSRLLRSFRRLLVTLDTVQARGTSHSASFVAWPSPISFTSNLLLRGHFDLFAV